MSDTNMIEGVGSSMLGVKIVIMVFGFALFTALLVRFILRQRCPNCQSSRIQIICVMEDLTCIPRTRLLCTKCYTLHDRFRGGWRKVK